MEFLEPKRINKLLEKYNGAWMIAGGWAIDLFLGKETRIHDDIEIAIPRNEQLSIKSFLNNWNLNFIKAGKVIRWKQEILLELPIHEIHGNHKENHIEILLNEIEDKNWKFRRNLKIEYPLEKTIISSKSGIPILCPEIVLLYKSKSNRAKDKKDLLNVIEIIDKTSLNWLKDGIQKTIGNQHEWIDIIEKGTQHPTKYILS